MALELREPASVKLEVLDLSGRRIRTLWSGPLAAGRRTVMWDGRANDDRNVAGVYWLVATSRGERLATKVVWIP